MYGTFSRANNGNKRERQDHMNKNNGSEKKRSMKWQYRVILIAVLVAVVDVFFCKWMAKRANAKNDYSTALEITDAEGMKQLQN